MKTHGTVIKGAGVYGIKASPHVMIKVRRIFPRASQARGGAVILADTPEVARDLEWLLDRYPMEADEKTRAWLGEQADRHRATEVTVAEILLGNRPDRELREPARPARDYQLVAADLVLSTGRLLLVDDLGLGKSMSALLVLREPAALPAVVVCLTHLPRQWQEELEKTLPWLTSHIVKTMTPYVIAERRGMGGVDPDVIIVPYSKLRGWADYLAGRVKTVIFDEAQELRRRESQKWEAARQIAEDATFRIGTTATPVYNYAGEIHTIYEVIAPDVLGSRDEFIREWQGVSMGNDHIRVGEPGALGTYLRDEGLMLSRTRKDVGRELPEVIRVPHSIDSDENVFERLVEEAVELAELIVEHTAAREELWRASGEFDWRLRRATGIAKAHYVADFVKLLLESDEQVVLFGWHRDVYDIWAQRLAAHKPLFYTGTESPNQKQRNRDAFLAGDSRVFVMSLRAGAGLDGLQQVCNVAVFGELDWSPGMHDQCIGRLHRDGQDEPVVAYFLVSDYGSDPVMAEVLNLKRQQSEPLRNPDAAILEPIVDTSDRVRRLAEDVLSRRRANPVTHERQPEKASGSSTTDVGR